MEKIDILKNGYKIIQDTERFQFGIDAVLLADFASKAIKGGDSIIDLGTGTGIIPLLMDGKLNKDIEKGAPPHLPVKFVGLEIQKASADMAARSVALNNLNERINIKNGDLKNIADSKIFKRHSFSAVTCNPPYMIDSHGKSNALDALTIARHEVLCTLEDVIAAADYLLETHGKFFLIHRPFRLTEIFESLFRHKMEPKRLRLIYPFLDKEPNMVLIEARKNANPRLNIEPPLIVRDNAGQNAGQYTKEIRKIYGEDL